MPDVMVMKGTKLRVRRFVIPSLRFSLAGTQMKFAAKQEEFDCVVLHVRGDHPTEPKLIELIVKREDTGKEDTVTPSEVIGVYPPDKDSVV